MAEMLVGYPTIFCVPNEKQFKVFRLETFLE